MSDSVINSAFKDTASAAEAMLGKIEAEVSAPMVVETKTVEPPVVETPVAEPSQPVEATSTENQEPQILDVAPDTKVRIKVNGEEKIVSAKEYSEILSRTDVFTQKTQNLARQREELEQHYVAREAQLQQAQAYVQQAMAQLQQQGDPVQRLVQELTKTQTQNQPPQNVNEIATIGEVQTLINALQERQQQELMQIKQLTQQEILNAKEQAKREAREETTFAQDQKRVRDTLDEIMNSPDGKLLKELNPQAETLIRFNALKMNPESVDEAVNNLKIYASGWAEKVRGLTTQQQTAQAVKTAKTVMEPPAVGAAPTIVQKPQQPALKKDGSVDWNALRERALSYLEN